MPIEFDTTSFIGRSLNEEKLIVDAFYRNAPQFKSYNIGDEAIDNKKQIYQKVICKNRLIRALERYLEDYYFHTRFGVCEFISDVMYGEPWYIDEELNLNFYDFSKIYTLDQWIDSVHGYSKIRIEWVKSILKLLKNENVVLILCAYGGHYRQHSRFIYMKSTGDTKSRKNIEAFRRRTLKLVKTACNV